MLLLRSKNRRYRLMTTFSCKASLRTTFIFDANSRYAKIPIVEVETATGKKANAVKLRRLPYTPGNLTEVKGTDRLDIMAHRRFADGTKFWHIADSNTELEANDLVANERSENPLATEETKFILVPES